MYSIKNLTAVKEKSKLNRLVFYNDYYKKI